MSVLWHTRIWARPFIEVTFIEVTQYSKSPFANVASCILYRDHQIQEWKAWRRHVTKGLVYLVSWDREKGRGINRNQVINWVHSSIYLYVPYSLFTFNLVIPVNLCVYGLKQSYMSGFFCTFVHIMLSGTCFFEGNSQQTVRDTHGATVIMQGKGNNSKDKTITKRSMHDRLK